MLAVDDLEAIWERLAEAIDQAGPDHARLMLAKLALLMAEALGDKDKTMVLIKQATDDLT